LAFKDTVHPKSLILSSFTHPHVFPNLHEFLSSVELKRRHFKKNVGNQTVDGTLWLP